MKTLLLLATCGLFAALPLRADVEAAVVTTSDGTIAHYEPGTQFVVTQAGAPVTYYYAPTVTYVTRSGVVIPEAQVRTRLVVGRPVSVHYVTQGERRVVSRVVVDDDDDDDDDDD